MECVKNRSDPGALKLFPFEEDKIDRWFSQKDNDQVYIKNTRFNTKITSIAIGASFLLTKEATWWYHGTSHESALSLLKDGIVLEKGQNEQDFSTGHALYLSKFFQIAITWAKRNKKLIKKKGSRVGILWTFRFFLRFRSFQQ